MSDKIILTAEYVRSILNYNPDTGIFTWRPRPLDHFKSEMACKTWNSRFSGKTAGSINNNGYVNIVINYVQTRGHVLAWLYEHGSWPKKKLDHINGIKSDNRICNLRLATDSQNDYNSKIPKNNKSGYKGVHPEKRTGKWYSQIQVNKKRICLGTFDTPEEARAAYCAAAIKYHGEFARTE